MHFDLNTDQTEIVAARVETENRIRLEQEKFERFVERRRGRLERERSNNQERLSGALSKSLGVAIPRGAIIAIGQDGRGVIDWQNPTKPKAATKPPVTPVENQEAAAVAEPSNGELVGATP